MSNFMPVNEASGQALNDRLAQTMFNSAADFVKFYNSGLINKKNDEVSTLVAEVTTVFKNVKERGGELVFLSQQEVYLNEVIAALLPWEILVKAKREVEAMTAAGIIDGDTILAFGKKHSGYILASAGDVEGGDFEKVGTEKVFNKFDEVSPIFERGLIDGERVGDAYVFHAQELLDLDDSFILNIREIIPG